jgi:predicted alpha/beta superfamily hydrolase
MSSAYPEVTLPTTQVRLLRSSIVNDTYTLHIAVPVTYARSNKRYPVVYVADGNDAFPLVRLLCETLSAGLEIPRVIVVGIGYDSTKSKDWGRYRERDFLPTDASARDPARRQAYTRSGIRRGQADAFLRFIREELKPFINANYRTTPSDSAYLGTSYGGLFGLYALFRHPETFSRYVIGSPAIHHDGRVIMQLESEYAATHSDLPARVFLAVGAREELDDPLIEPVFQFVTNVKTLAATLEQRRFPGLQLRTHVFEGETHLSVIPAAFSRGLRAVYDRSGS